MKVAYVTMSYPVGSEAFFDSDIRALEKKNIEVSVLSYFKGNRMGTQKNASYGSAVRGLLSMIKEPILSLKVIVWIFSNQNIFSKSFLKSIFLLPKSFSIYDRVKSDAPDVVHLFWGHYPSISGFIILESDLETKVTMFLGAYDLELGLGLSSSLGKKLNYIFTHSNSNISMIKKLCGERASVRVIHRGVDLKLLQSIKPSKKINHMWVTAGRLIDTKRFDKVIDLFHQYQISYSDATLTIVGEGPQRPSLERKVNSLGLKNKVRFTGFVEQTELFKFLSRSSFFVFLSEKTGERLPNVVKEAMYFKNFCIVSATPGIEELIESPKEGFIIHDESETLTQINSLESRVEIIGHNANKKIENNFNSDLQMEKYLSFWRNRE